MSRLKNMLETWNKLFINILSIFFKFLLRIYKIIFKLYKISEKYDDTNSFINYITFGLGNLVTKFCWLIIKKKEKLLFINNTQYL